MRWLGFLLLIALLTRAQAKTFSAEQINGEKINSEQIKRIAQSSAGILKGHHYQLHWGPGLSRKWIDHYLRELDPGCHVFIQSDVQAISDSWGAIALEALEQGDFRPVWKIYRRYALRLNQELALLQAAQAEKRKYDGRSTLDRSEREGNCWPPDESARDQLLLKNLQNFPKELTSRWKKSIERGLSRPPQDLIAQYLNALAQSLDPHSEFFLTSQKQKWASVLAKKPGESEGRAKAYRVNVSGREVAIVRFDVFYNGVTQDLERLFRELAGHGVRSWILDLRSNRGGELAEATRVANGFLPEMGVGIVRNSQDIPVLLLEPHAQHFVLNAPGLVWISSQTASAAELLSSALQDYGRSVVIGEDSYGKGTIQSYFPLDDSEGPSLGGFKLTTMKYYRPSGKSVQWEGVHPDIFLQNPQGDQMRERDLPGALANDRVQSLNFHPDDLSAKIQALKSALSTDCKMDHERIPLCLIAVWDFLLEK